MDDPKIKWTIFGNMALFQKKSISWYFLPPIFCTPGLNDMKISETLLLYESYMVDENDGNSMFFVLVALL